MGKKFLSSLVCFVIGFFLLPTVAYADMGPKPSVHIDFMGIENKVYYITLLSKEKSTGPYSFSTEPIDESSFLVDEHKEDDLHAWQAFRNYNDIDGFYFIEYFKRCNDQNTFKWTYYPPSTFKVLIYFPEENRFATTEIQDKYAFDSYYKVSLSENQTELTVEKNYDYSTETTSLIARILLTLSVEILIALLFGLRKKNIILFVLVVNVVTQTILNILLNVVNYTSGRFAFVFNYIWMEGLIILIEAIVFSFYFKKSSTNKPIKKWVAPVYSIVANSASFAIGLFISIKLPGIF